MRKIKWNFTKLVARHRKERKGKKIKKNKKITRYWQQVPVNTILGNVYK